MERADDPLAKTTPKFFGAGRAEREAAANVAYRSRFCEMAAVVEAPLDFGSFVRCPFFVHHAGVRRSLRHSTFGYPTAYPFDDGLYVVPVVSVHSSDPFAPHVAQDLGMKLHFTRPVLWQAAWPERRHSLQGKAALRA